MGRRTTVHVTRRTLASGGVSPNATIAQITVDLRIVHPPGTDSAELLAQLDAAVAEAKAAIVNRT